MNNNEYNSSCHCSMCNQYRYQLITGFNQANGIVEYFPSNYKWDDTWSFIDSLKVE